MKGQFVNELFQRWNKINEKTKVAREVKVIIKLRSRQLKILFKGLNFQRHVLVEIWIKCTLKILPEIGLF